MCSVAQGEKVISVSVAWAHTPPPFLFAAILRFNLDVGMQEFLPVIFHSLILTNNQKFIAPHVGFVFQLNIVTHGDGYNVSL